MNLRQTVSLSLGSLTLVILVMLAPLLIETKSEFYASVSDEGRRSPNYEDASVKPL